jgi:predicted house-cleaning noncanonical NTP pyrophosphatase (MazG superfamily)
VAKLVRDLIPDIIRADGQEPIVEVVHDPQRLLELTLDKVVEEAQELREGRNVEELADALETLQAAARRLGLTWEQVEAARHDKWCRRGGFDGGIVLLEIR